jgi:Flp pilus assembly protein TadD
MSPVQVADCHNELAVALQEMGEPALAEREARAALSLHIALFGEVHVYTGTCICNLATLLQQQGKLHPAEMLLRHCLRCASPPPSPCERARTPLCFLTSAFSPLPSHLCPS